MIRLALAVAVFAFGGCSKRDDDADCRKRFETERRCSIQGLTGPGSSSDGPGIYEPVSMKVCRALKARDSARLAAELKCSELASCDEYIICKNAAFATHHERPTVERALAEGRITDAWLACTINEDYFASAEFRRACQPAFAQGPTALTGKDLDEALYRCSGNAQMMRASPELAASCDVIRRRHEAVP